jgi:hypothetical protein
VKHYDSIENLPIWNFYKVKETGLLTYLIIDEGQHGAGITDKFSLELLEVWKSIDSRFITEFGMTEKFTNRMLLEKRILLLELDVIIKGDSLSKARLAAEKMKLDSSDNEVKALSINEIIVSVEKFMGFSINDRICPVQKFFGYVDLMRKVAAENEKLKAQNNG